MAKALVSVCLCTYRRETLRQCLESLQRQELPQGLDLEIVVVDNDAEASARAIAEAAAATGPFPVKYAVEPRKGIPFARNATLDRASGQWIAFIDDDEVASPNWITALYETARTCRAQAVVGDVVPKFAADAPKWIVEGEVFVKRHPPTGSKMHQGRTSNALVDAEPVRRHGLRFDERFAGTCGEDADFFKRLQHRGGTIVSCREAVVTEIIPAERISLAFIAERSVHRGEIHALNYFGRKGGPRQAGQMLSSAAKVAAGATASLAAFPFSRRLAASYFISSMINIGKLRYLFGFKPMTPYS